MQNLGPALYYYITPWSREDMVRAFCLNEISVERHNYHYAILVSEIDFEKSH